MHSFVDNACYDNGRLFLAQIVLDDGSFHSNSSSCGLLVTVVHVDDIFAVGRKARCDQFCEDLNRLFPINNLGELRWYAGCRYSRDRDAGTLTISQQAFAENTALKFGDISGRRNPLEKGLTLEEFDATYPRAAGLSANW